MPSRWSISCWMARALSPVASLPVAVAVAVERLEHDPLGPGHVAEDLGNGEAALLGGVAALALDDDRIDHLEPVLVGVHHRDPPRHARPGWRRAPRRGPRPSSRTGRRPGGGPRRRRRRPRRSAAGAPGEPSRCSGSRLMPAGAPGADGAADPDDPRALDDHGGGAALDGDAVSFTPADSTSLMSCTLPMIPPLVITSSPFLRLLSSSACFFRAWPDGRRIRK